jgi:hypothetical protein
VIENQELWCRITNIARKRNEAVEARRMTPGASDAIRGLAGRIGAAGVTSEQRQ